MRRVLVLSLLLAVASPVFSGTKKSSYPKNEKHMTVQDHYGLAMECYQEKKWVDMLDHCKVVKNKFGKTAFSDEIDYYLGLGYFRLGDFDLANRSFSEYLASQTSPKFFHEAVEYKFQIAKEFDSGAKKHMMGWDKMPRWIPAQEEALQIYDEVVTSLPRHEMAAEALYRKANLLAKLRDYETSVESYQTLIRRFPKHPLSAESYVGIALVYLRKTGAQFPDPSYLDLAEINLRKFRQEFPGEPRINEVESMLIGMKEEFAGELYENGKLFEKRKKKQAAALYYTTILRRYPETRQAVLSKKRLEKLNVKLPWEEETNCEKAP